MTIDERLEALTQSVELIAGMQRENERQIGELTQAVAHAQKENERQIALLTSHMVNMMQAMTRLSNTAAVHNVQFGDHEMRIAALEAKQGN